MRKYNHDTSKEDIHLLVRERYESLYPYADAVVVVTLLTNGIVQEEFVCYNNTIDSFEDHTRMKRDSHVDDSELD